MLYHGTPDNFDEPPILMPQTKGRDFGLGFYLTTYKEQAESWGNLIHQRRFYMWLKANNYPFPAPNETPTRFLKEYQKYYEKDYYIKIYSLDLKELKEIYNITEFKKYDEEWFDFVIYCRDNPNYKPNHDITIGPLADGGDLPNIILRYKDGEIEKEEALGLIKFKKDNDQYCIHNDTYCENI